MDKMSGIKNIVFDFGGVLIDLDKDLCISKFNSLGFDKIEELISCTHSAGVFSALEKGDVTAAEFRETLRKMCRQDVTDEQIDEAWLSILVDIPQYKLDMLLVLRKKYRVYMLSNTNEIHFEAAKKNIFEKDGHQLQDYFDHCYLSYEIGLIKPDDDVFEHVINDAQIFARESLFIDDSELNLDTARRWCFSTYLAKHHEDFSHLFK